MFSNFYFDPAPFELDQSASFLDEGTSSQSSTSLSPSLSINTSDLPLPWVDGNEPLWCPFVSPVLPAPNSSATSKESMLQPPHDPLLLSSGQSHLETIASPTVLSVPPAADSNIDYPSTPPPSSPLSPIQAEYEIPSPVSTRRPRITMVRNVPTDFQNAFQADPQPTSSEFIEATLNPQPSDWQLCKCTDKTKKPSRHFRTKCPYNPRLEPPVECDRCNTRFTRLDNMKRHKKIFHRIEETAAKDVPDGDEER